MTPWNAFYIGVAITVLDALMVQRLRYTVSLNFRDLYT